MKPQKKALVKEPNKSATVSVKVTDDHYDRLATAASRERRSLSEFVRLHLEEWDAADYPQKEARR